MKESDPEIASISDAESSLGVTKFKSESELAEHQFKQSVTQMGYFFPQKHTF